MSGFVVFVDKDGAVDPEVHTSDCFYYNNRKKNAVTTFWRGPYKTFSDAWKMCFEHALGQGRIPQTHDCVGK